ncbi:bestrophin family protein [Lichenihabitans sp. Uapishka_5]|uniref:bestrophin family protein n=1 Tax=Lichenihabitans sp. Uapishka_5 TaxID=3037302 RepID=UPI0029E7CD1B|nr:bestrophin family protein [Lichenihabitans sp. Uapishka_5]MDX7953507.1 bestrophin family protein [Lichenihabitans sp. Uapishka_5]
MIVRTKPTTLQLLFQMRGSVIPRIKWRIGGVVVLSFLAVALQDGHWINAAPAAALPFSLIGIALSIFAGFRNSACYDRWWEGRKIWGQSLVDIRSLTRQALVYGAHGDVAQARPIALRAVAFLYALRDRLRGDPLGPEALACLPEPEWDRLRAARNAPNLILRAVSADIAIWLAQGRIEAQTAMTMEAQVIALSGTLAASERLRGTPIPFTYSLLLHRTAYLFCLLLPFGLVPAAGGWTPVAVAIVSYTFFGLDALGDELEAPFGRGANGLPLDALARTAEISVREMLGDANLPAEVAAVAEVLL